MLEEIMKKFLNKDAKPVDADAPAQDIFQLPIAFLENKAVLEEHTINDLELLPSDTSLYKYVFNPTTLFGEQTIGLWSKYYTADTTFLKESQQLLKHKKAHLPSVNADVQIKMDVIWREIKAETGFA